MADKYCAAVELLLARMESNPEEFTPPSRWKSYIDRYHMHLSDEDAKALQAGLDAVSLDGFHKAVMSELLNEPEEVGDGVMRIGKSGSWGVGATAHSSQLVSGNVGIGTTATQLTELHNAYQNMAAQYPTALAQQAAADTNLYGQVRKLLGGSF